MTTAKEELRVSAAPYLWRGMSVSKRMNLIFVALMFPAAAAIYYYGYRALFIMLTSVVSAVVTEYLVKKLRGKPFVLDGYAQVIGLLFALTLPPTVDLWIVAIGTIFAVGVVKEAFGGLGYHVFHPALAARAALAASFATMSVWIRPTGFSGDLIIAEAPLGESFVWSFRFGARMALYRDMLLGNVAGNIGETSVILILLGAIILLVFRLIDWRLPAVYLGTVVVLSLAFGADPAFQLLAGGLMLGAFFIAPDTVTSPVTHNGRIIFAVGCGLMTVIIRLFGTLPEGVYYAILFMNAVTPLIDRYVKVRPLGLPRKAVKKSATA